MVVEKMKGEKRSGDITGGQSGPVKSALIPFGLCGYSASVSDMPMFVQW
jgi:hypothetical protein